jgi:DNA polymerase-3 subunit alpha
VTATEGFTHLEVHSQHSLLAGTATVEALARRAAGEGLASLALTDTNALYGAVAFARTCQVEGIQPIIGMTVTTAPPARSMPPQGGLGRLVLLATGPAGYRSLCRLSSLLQAHSDREARLAQGLDWTALEAHREGLLCLSGGRVGWAERLLRAGDRYGARRTLAHLAEVYGDGAYLALEIHRPEDRAVASEMRALGQGLGIPAAAVQPVHCLVPEEADRLRLLAAIDHNVLLEQVPPAALPGSGEKGVGQHWLRQEEVAERFVGLEEALDVAAEIAARCGPALPGGQPIWPDLHLPGGQEPEQALTELARAGLARRYDPAGQDGDPAKAPAAAEARLQIELEAICGRGFAPLFLVVADIARFARTAGIPINTRGSVANSLVAYCAGITDVDPLAHDLLFERFLTPSRADLPDIDLDFCSRRRDEVLAYVRRTYGADRVALVSTMSTLQPRGAVRETAKAYGLDEAGIGRLVAMLPRHWHPDPRRRDKRTADDVLAELADSRLRQIVRDAYGLVGQPHHLSVHPGGLVITPGPLTDVVPLQWAPKGFVITQFDHGDVEAIGLPKLDLLGIRALTVLADAEALVQRDHDPSFQLAEMPLDDEATAGLLARAETVGVFQCESVGARRTLRRLQARTVRDLAVANAFFKPGPATGGMARAFVQRYRGQAAVQYLHPALVPILEPTMGVLLFQEQVLRVAREVAGLTWAEADQLRRGMGHFGREEMAALEARFVEGCRRPQAQGPGMSRQQAETLWEQVYAFSGYGFNQGHATAYALVSYRSAYLKAHWPAAFLCARLVEWGGFHHPAVYMAEARRLGLAVRPPHVNHSQRQFALGWEGEQGVLWMGLGQVRDLRRASVRAIVAARVRRPYGGLRDLLQRVPLQPKEAAHLIQCGALDGLGESRASMLAEAQEVERAGSSLQMSFAFARRVVAPETATQRLTWELHLLGQPVSVHPLEVIGDRLPEHVPLGQLAGSAGQRLATAGVRLPGWTGRPGFYLADGMTFVVARTEQGQPVPAPWEPLLVRGQWVVDEWGDEWLQVSKIERIGAAGG